VRQARSQLEFARNDLRRASELAAKQAIAERVLEKAQLDAASADAALASAEAALEARRRELESAQARMIQPGGPVVLPEDCCVNVQAPISGTVLRIVAESEQVVQAGAPLVEIGDPRDLEIAIDLLSRDAVRVRPGATARIEGWGGDTPLNARVRRIEPTGVTKVSALGIEEQRVKVILDFTDPPESRPNLGHGFRVVGRITVWRGDDVPLVPLGALFRRDGNWAVFIVSDGRATLRMIDIAERNLHAARVVAGLAEGDRIILHPSDQVREGVAVAPRN
jgi:HlyD family secretion protein